MTPPLLIVNGFSVNGAQSNPACREFLIQGLAARRITRDQAELILKLCGFENSKLTEPEIRHMTRAVIPERQALKILEREAWKAMPPPEAYRNPPYPPTPDKVREYMDRLESAYVMPYVNMRL